MRRKRRRKRSSNSSLVSGFERTFWILVALNMLHSTNGSVSRFVFLLTSSQLDSNSCCLDPCMTQCSNHTRSHS